jgi:hypothetical protein
MLYTIRFHYCRVVQAGSSEEAYQKVCRQIKEDPGSAISRVDWGAAEKRKPGVFRRLLTG